MKIFAAVLLLAVQAYGSGGSDQCCTINFSDCFGDVFCDSKQENCETHCLGIWFDLDEDPTCVPRWEKCDTSSECCDGLNCVAFDVNTDFQGCGIEGVDGMTVDAPTAAPTPCPTELEGQPISDFLGLDALTIPDIQGNRLTSPFLDAGDVTVQCIVTAIDSNLFFCQDPIGDGDDSTSDAFSVFTGSFPDDDNNVDLEVGDLVQMTDDVSEFQPGDDEDRNLSSTQFSFPSITIISRGNDLPAPVLIGRSGRSIPTTTLEEYVEFWESLEAMRVTLEDPITTAATNFFEETWVAVNQAADVSTLSASFGTNILTPDNFGPPAIQVDPDSTITPAGPSFFNVGTTLQDVTGVVSYAFGTFEVIPTEPLVIIDAPLPTPTVTSFSATGNTLLIGSYNVLNLDPNDEDGDEDVANGRFEAIAQVICTNMGSPDVVGLQEIQDNTGSDDDGVTAADVTLSMLVDAIENECSLMYEFIDNTFIIDGASGGQPGGNIRTAYLYNPARISLVEGSVSATTNIPQDDPTNPFFGSRLPLAATFTFTPTGTQFVVVNNHFSSKGGSAPTQSFVQPFEELQSTPLVNGGVDERLSQAIGNREFIESLNTENTIVLGDLNEFEFVKPLLLLTATPLRNLVEQIELDERFSFTFQGNSQVLDHILVGPPLACSSEAEFIHVGPTIFATNPSVSGLRDGSVTPSDHDPIVAAIEL